MMDLSLVSPCNYYCGNCAVYKRGKCLGCARASQKATAERKVFCEISDCARDKKLVACSDCLDYPCDKYDDSIFSENFIEWIRDKLDENP